MLSGRSLQRHSARWRRGLEFNVTAIAIHRGQFAKMVARLLGPIVIVIAGHSGDALAMPHDNVKSTRTASGYPYIGEAANLKARLSRHTSQSDRVTLNQYLHSGAEGSITVELHTFGDRSPAKELKIRRAYESELIRSRQPRFNIRP